jgi:histidine triad (HIT) family protein
MTDPNCVFCKIANKEIPAAVIHETDSVIAFVDMHPNNFGHSLVVPKDHLPNVYDLDEASWSAIGPVISRISKAVKKAVNADGINVHMNNDPAAGQVIFHAHFHIIPRFESDGLKHFDQKSYEYPEQIEELAQKISSAIV